MPGDGFADYAAEVGGEREIASFVKLRLIEAGPLAVDFPALHGASHDEHHVGVAVVSAAIAVLSRGTAELRHSDNDGVISEIAEIDPERRERLREFAEHIRYLPLRAAFIDVMIPATDVGEGDLHAEVGFDELRELAEAVTEASAGIIGAGRG